MPLEGSVEPTWRKRILFPFWGVRIFFIAIVVATFALLLSIFGRATADGDRFSHHGDGYTGSIAVLSIFFVCLILCLILDIASIVLYGLRSLNPRTFLIINVAQTTFWFIMLVLGLIGATLAQSGTAVVSAFIVFFMYLGLLLYAAVMYHRSRRAARAKTTYAVAISSASPSSVPGEYYAPAMPSSPPPPFSPGNVYVPPSRHQTNPFKDGFESVELTEQRR